MAAPDDLREWASFEDPEERRIWLFDLSFLTSHWTCIYGRGCLGAGSAVGEPHPFGCCAKGVCLNGEADRQRVEAASAQLGPERWQHIEAARRHGGALFRDRDQWRTRRAQGACILLNHDGFLGGAGCALHFLAQDQGRGIAAVKPETCCEVPLRRVDYDHCPGWVLSVVREWSALDWSVTGEPAGWWCTADPAAFCGEEPVYRSTQGELIALVGERVYRLLVERIEALGGRGIQPHPLEPL